MSPVRSKPKSPLEKLQQIDRLTLKFNDRLAPLEAENAQHVPRTTPLPRGSTALTTRCDPSCPTCLLMRKHYNRRSGLGRVQQELLLELGRQSVRDAASRRQTAQVLKLLDQWIETREQYCKNWRDIPGLKPEHKKQASDCLDGLQKVREYRNTIGEHQAWWALAMLATGQAVEPLTKFRDDMATELAVIKRELTKRRKVLDRQELLRSLIENSEVQKDEIENHRADRAALLQHFSWRLAGLEPPQKVSQRTFSNDLKALGYKPK